MLWIDSMWFESFYLKGHARECERKNSWKNDRVNQYWQWNIITDGFITAHSIHLRAPFYQNSIQYLIYILFYLRLSPYCSWFSLIRISRKLFAKWKMCVCTVHYAHNGSATSWTETRARDRGTTQKTRARLLSRWQWTINYKWIACEAFDYMVCVIKAAIISWPLALYRMIMIEIS